MLGLELRKEFRSRRLKGTAIELSNSKNTGATQIAATDFLEITYPSSDALQAIRAVGPGQGKSLVFIGDRGQGKSHLMALLYHVFRSSEAVQDWLVQWSDRLNKPEIAHLKLRGEMEVIHESLHRQNYKFLWDLLFERHPHGDYVRGQWEGLGEGKTDVPGEKFLLELFKHTPTVLILDEYQTWYEGLTNTKQYPWKNWAFNFIQVLSEIADKHPNRLVLVVSLRHGRSDAFQQIQRCPHIIVDFKSPTAKQDRQRLLLHRLFENRMQVPDERITDIIEPHVSEYLRLYRTPPSDHGKVRHEFLQCWPFAPHLMQLLEDQVLVATQAQETRDLIRILAGLFKGCREVPVITAADFGLNDDKNGGMAALLDSVAHEHHADLREHAQRNLRAVQDAVDQSQVSHLYEIMSSLWLRSLSVGNVVGADAASLQVDITRDQPINDNDFEVELDRIEETSFNIHREGDRLIFKAEENPRAKLMASAKNHKLFENGEDKKQLAKEIRYVLSGNEEVSREFRVVVLPEDYWQDPWETVDEKDRPENWDERQPLLVLPQSPEDVSSDLGSWLRDHLNRKRNVVRFLLPTSGSVPLFHDQELLLYGRAIVLAQEWKVHSPQGSAYKSLEREFQSNLRKILAERFDRFAILKTWDFQNPKQCTFHVHCHREKGNHVPEAVKKYIHDQLFIPEDFADFMLLASEQGKSIGELLEELQEPRPGGDGCIPWLGETALRDEILRICAHGKVAINLRGGGEILQKRSDEDHKAALQRMRPKLSAVSGKHLDETRLLKPQVVARSQGVVVDIDSGSQKNPGDKTLHSMNDSLEVHRGSSIGEKVEFNQNVHHISFVSQSTSALNLMAQLESWNIQKSEGTQISDLSLEIDSLTGAQLHEILKLLPDGLTYRLSLSKEEGSGSTA